MPADPPDAASTQPTYSSSGRALKRSQKAAYMDADNEQRRLQQVARDRRNMVAASIAKQPIVFDFPTKYEYGPADGFIDPGATNDEEFDLQHFDEALGEYLLRRFTAYGGDDDLRQAWEAPNREITVDDLEKEIDHRMKLGVTYGTVSQDKGKGKAVAGPAQPTNYSGITTSSSVPLGPTSKTEHSAHPEDEHESSRPTKKSRTVPGDSAPNPQNGAEADAPPSSAASRASPLVRNDSSTVIDGHVVYFPQNKRPSYVPATAETLPDTPPRKKPGHVPARPTQSSTTRSSAPRKSAPAQPSGGLKLSSVGSKTAPAAPSRPKATPVVKFGSKPRPSEATSRVPAPRAPPADPPAPVAPSPRASPARVPLPPHQPQHPNPSRHGAGGRPAPQPNHGSPPASDHMRKSVAMPPVSRAPQTTSRRQTTNGRAEERARQGLGSVSATASSHVRAGRIGVNNTPVSANATGSKESHRQVSGQPRPPAPPVGHEARQPVRQPPSPRRRADNRDPPPRPARERLPADADVEQEMAIQESDDEADVAAGVMYNHTNTREVRLHKGKITLKSFAPVTQPTVKLFRQIAQAQIIAYGSYEWMSGDPGEAVPKHEAIVAKCWAEACKKLGYTYPLLQEHLIYVEALVASARARFKRALEPLVVRHYRFRAGQPDENIELSDSLLPHAFHETPAPKGGVIPFYHPYIREACTALVFDGAQSLGIRYSRFFNPVPHRFIALVGTLTNHVIYAYRDGEYKKSDRLDATQQIQSFRTYMKRVEEMDQKQPNSLLKLCGSIHDDARITYEQALQKTPPPAPPIEWAADDPVPYVPRFANPASDEDMEDLQQEGRQPVAPRKDARNAHVPPRQSTHHRRPDQRPPSQPEAGPSGLRRGSSNSPGPSRVRANQEVDAAPNWPSAPGPSQPKHRSVNGNQVRPILNLPPPSDDEDLPSPSQIRASDTYYDDGAQFQDGAYPDDYDEEDDVAQNIPLDEEEAEFSDEAEREMDLDS